MSGQSRRDGLLEEIPDHKVLLTNRFPPLKIGM